MTNSFRVSAAVLTAIVGGVAVSANADVIIVTATYHALAGSYTQSTDPMVGAFSAVAVNTATLASDYEVTRLGSPSATASFEAGFVSNPLNPADFQINLSVVKISPTLASGSGTFLATDKDGDTFGGTISGFWIKGNTQFTFFNGNINTTFTDNGAADNTFDGTEGGDFSMNFAPLTPPFPGSVVQLVFDGSNFFSSDFSDKSTGGSMQVVPSPGSVALLGLGGLAIATRRRSRA